MTNYVDDNDAYFALRGDCLYCKHPAHCGLSCFEEQCDDCTECGCRICQKSHVLDGKILGNDTIY